MLVEIRLVCTGNHMDDDVRMMLSSSGTILVEVSVRLTQVIVIYAI